MKIGFHPKASEEFIQSSEYYELQVTGLGEEFINEIERSTELLSENPKLGIELDQPFRRVLLYRFPYSLIYIIERDNLWVADVVVRREKIKVSNGINRNIISFK